MTIRLRHLELLRFRHFFQQHAEFGEVTLITGSNSSGKSTLLEALALACGAGDLKTVAGALAWRGGIPSESYFLWHELMEGNERGEAVYVRGSGGDLGEFEVALRCLEESADRAVEARIKVPQEPDRFSTLTWFGEGLKSQTVEWGCPVRLVGWTEESSLGRLWPAIAHSEEADFVADGLARLDRRVREISLLDQSGARKAGDFEGGIFGVRLEGVGRWVPLSQLGRGMTRMLGLLLALATTRRALILVDEIEAGLWAGAGRSAWEGLLDFVRRQEHQLVATTHATEWVEEGVGAAQERDQDFQLIRCFGPDPEVEREAAVVCYDAQQLLAALDAGWDVR